MLPVLILVLTSAAAPRTARRSDWKAQQLSLCGRSADNLYSQFAMFPSRPISRTSFGPIAPEAVAFHTCDVERVYATEQIEQIEKVITTRGASVVIDA